MRSYGKWLYSRVVCNFAESQREFENPPESEGKREAGNHEERERPRETNPLQVLAWGGFTNNTVHGVDQSHSAQDRWT